MTEDDGGYGIHTLRLDWIWKHATHGFERNLQHSTVPQTMHAGTAITSAKQPGLAGIFSCNSDAFTSLVSDSCLLFPYWKCAGSHVSGVYCMYLRYST